MSLKRHYQQKNSVVIKTLLNNRNSRFFPDYGRSPHALVSQRVYSPIYIRIKMAKITRMEQKGLKKIKEIQVKEFV
jgi:hypothetical protein